MLIQKLLVLKSVGVIFLVVVGEFVVFVGDSSSLWWEIRLPCSGGIRLLCGGGFGFFVVGNSASLYIIIICKLNKN